MPETTRRTIMRKGAMAMAASLVAARSSYKAEALTMTTGFIHVFAFQWKPGTTPDQIERARKQIVAFQGVIPGLVAIHVGANHSDKNKGYTFGGVMEFANQVALEAYTVHSAHKALLEWLVPLIDAMELDLNA